MAATQQKFNPNALTFDQGVERIQKSIKASGYDFKSKITTSQDSVAKAAIEKLIVSNVPKGFKKFQLPFYLDGPSQMFVSVGTPDTVVGRHSHEEGDGLRYIVSGSIIYNDRELHAGDWMYIPAGIPYEFKVGSQGATMMYCYQCCCA